MIATVIISIIIVIALAAALRSVIKGKKNGFRMCGASQKVKTCKLSV